MLSVHYHICFRAIIYWYTLLHRSLQSLILDTGDVLLPNGIGHHRVGLTR